MVVLICQAGDQVILERELALAFEHRGLRTTSLDAYADVPANRLGDVFVGTDMVVVLVLTPVALRSASVHAVLEWVWKERIRIMVVASEPMDRVALASAGRAYERLGYLQWYHLDSTPRPRRLDLDGAIDDFMLSLERDVPCAAAPARASRGEGTRAAPCASRARPLSGIAKILALPFVLPAMGIAAVASGAVYAAGVASRTARSLIPLRSAMFTATFPGSVGRGRMFLLDVWIHSPKRRSEVVRRAREDAGDAPLLARGTDALELTLGTRLEVALHVQGAHVSPTTSIIEWTGSLSHVTFFVQVPASLSTGDCPARVDIRVEGLQLARIDLVLRVEDPAAAESRRKVPYESRSVSAVSFEKAFASYASQDRDEVLGRIQGIQKAAPHMKFFLDVASLRSKEKWAKKLLRVIPQNDVFYLFWSKRASESEWVEEEWRCALEERGIDFIDPVPLETPDQAPPPKELAQLHFNDWVLAYKSSKAKA